MSAPATIPVGAIDDANRLRPVDPAHVQLIAAAIEQQGLLQPISVRLIADEFGYYKLVVGGHRFAALKELGWKELVVGEHVIIVETDDFSAQIMEIDENVARHDLNALDRALFLARRKKLYEERNRTFGHGGKRKDGKFKDEQLSQSLRLGFSPRFTEDAAKRTGYAERTIQLAVSLAEALSPDAIAAIRGTMVERNQNELLLLAGIDDRAEQLACAEKIRSGEAKTVSQAKVATGLSHALSDDPQDRILARLVSEFSKASAKTRKAFMAEYGLVYGKGEK